MAKTEETSLGELCDLHVSKVANGYKIEVGHSSEPTLSQRAGWTPSSACVHKTFVEKTKAAVLSRLKELLK